MNVGDKVWSKVDGSGPYLVLGFAAAGGRRGEKQITREPCLVLLDSGGQGPARLPAALSLGESVDTGGTVAMAGFFTHEDPHALPAMPEPTWWERNARAVTLSALGLGGAVCGAASLVWLLSTKSLWSWGW